MDDGITLDDAALFFYEHAGFSYPTGSSEYEQEKHRQRCAMDLAIAEQDILDFDPSYAWDWDTDGMICFMYLNQEPFIEGSMGGIDEPDDNYRRVIEAEIAQEWLSTLED